MRDSFVLEGVRYYQQYRRCGRDNCRCSAGDLHGPYWYARARADGKRRYIGSKLPDNVVNAQRVMGSGHVKLRLQAMADTLRAQLRAIEALIGRERLTASQQNRLRDMGLGACLVLPGGDAVTQDKPESAPPDVVMRRLGADTLPGFGDV